MRAVVDLNPDTYAPTDTYAGTPERTGNPGFEDSHRFSATLSGVRLNVRAKAVRFCGVLVAVILVGSGCTFGESDEALFSDRSALEAGTSTAPSGSTQTTAPPDDHPALTVTLDDPDAPTAVAPSDQEASDDSSDDADSPRTTDTDSSTSDSSTSESSSTAPSESSRSDSSQSGSSATTASGGTSSTADERTGGSSGNESESASGSDAPTKFVTLGPGAALPSGDQCAAWVRASGSDREHRPDNAGANGTVPSSAVTNGLNIDGADSSRNQALAGRIDGNFTGTTDQILRWGACKWGFDENITRARAVVESSWRMSTTGDRTDDGELCRRIGLSAPCPQSYGLLQVKGTVHGRTYPTTAKATAFGVDYAMAWLRACYEGGFGWLSGTGNGPAYSSGDEWGCVGAWFSGNWWDQGANDYVGKVRYALDQRAWESYR